MIILGNHNDRYHKKLAIELSKYTFVKAYDFCVKEFPDHEYITRIVDSHCGHGKCDLSCPNDPKRFRKDLEKYGKVVLVVRGRSGASWNSDKIINITHQLVDVMKGDDPEYKGLNAEKLCVLWPYQPYSKQDRIFTSDGTSDGELIYASPKTSTTIRKNLKRAGVDLLITVFPHDYRREGWIYKKAFPGKEHEVLTDWHNLPKSEQEKLETLEDWRGFAYAVDPTYSLACYLWENKIPVDRFVSPDGTASALSVNLSKHYGVWSAGLEKKRSRIDGTSELLTYLTEEIVGGEDVFIVDDMIVTGGTLIKAINEAKRVGAKSVSCMAFHGKFTEGALNKLREAGAKIYTMDTVENPTGVIESAPDVARRLYHYFV